MAAIDQPAPNALAVREAAAACRLSPRTIRRKLSAGAFPNAYKAESVSTPGTTLWKIPVADLERAGLNPVLVHPTFANSVQNAEASPETSNPTVLELVRSDRFGRLRAELAEAVAAAEIALLRAEAERWRVIAEERAQALERADRALKALTTAIESGGQAPGAQPVRSDVVTVPPLVRAEAMRYTATLQALHDMRKQERRWWHFWH